MPKSAAFDVRDIYTIAGPEIAAIYERNKMAVHFQGMSKTLQFPQTVALQGAPTCSIGISPYGLYNRLNDAGRLIMLNQKAIQFGSAPFRPHRRQAHHAHTAIAGGLPRLADDIPALQNYYHPPIAEKDVSLTIATPSMEMAFKIGKVKVIRRLISPLLSGNEQTLMPIGVEEYEVQNASNEAQAITLVVPRPSLVNLQEKELKPTDQDSVYICSAAVHGQQHEAFESDGVRGIVMGSTETPNRMVLAVAETPGVSIDISALLLPEPARRRICCSTTTAVSMKNGRPCFRSDYGSAVSLTFTVEPKATRKVAIAVALDFPEQEYIDGTKFERKYVKNFKDNESRAVDLARLALDSYPQWRDRTVAIQKRIFDSIQSSPSYKGDRPAPCA